jgi:hypothetical protein
MKSLIAGLIAILALAGCVAVPYEPAPVGYYYGPYYAAPPAVSFSYSYSNGGYRRRW